MKRVGCTFVPFALFLHGNAKWHVCLFPLLQLLIADDCSMFWLTYRFHDSTAPPGEWKKSSPSFFMSAFCNISRTGLFGKAARNLIGFLVYFIGGGGPHVILEAIAHIHTYMPLPLMIPLNIQSSVATMIWPLTHQCAKQVKGHWCILIFPLSISLSLSACIDRIDSPTPQTVIDRMKTPSFLAFTRFTAGKPTRSGEPGRRVAPQPWHRSQLRPTSL